jgi:NAD(P)-dependent dehydrogenase (short-subunit alcohol dehydrogenase family)
MRQLSADEEEGMKTILITGANRGIGLEFCKRYARDGWRILACTRCPERSGVLNTLAASHRKAGRSGPNCLNSKPSILSGISADSHAASSTVGSITA